MGIINILKLKPFWEHFVKLKKENYTLFKFLKHLKLLKSDPSFLRVYFETVYELETKRAKHDSIVKMYLSVSVREFFKDQYYGKKDFLVDAVMAELSFPEYDLVRVNMEADLKDLHNTFSEKISSLQTPYEIKTENLLNRIYEDINSKIDLDATIQTISKLRSENKHSKVLEILLQLKTTNWAQISDRSKYQLQLEIGRTHEDLGQYKEASICYISLMDYSFNTLEALSLAAYGYSLILDKENAINLSDQALKLSSKSKYAILAKLRVHSQPISLSQLKDLIPEELLLDEEIVFTGSLLLTKSDYSDDALEYISSVNINDIKNVSLRFDLLSLRSELQITRIKNRQRFFYKQYTTDEKNIIIEAEKDYVSAFEYYEQIGRGAEKVYMLINIASIRKMFGEDILAERELRRAILIKKDYDIYRMLLLLPHLTAGQLDDLIAECETLELKNFQMLELAVSKYNSYHLKGQKEEGLDVLLKSEQFIHQDDEKIQYYPIIIDSLLDNKKHAEAQSYISSLIELFSDNPLGYYYQELLNAACDKTDIRSKYLDIAKSKLTPDSSISHFQMIGDFYIDYGNVKAAIEVITLCPISSIGMGQLTDRLLKLHARNGSHAEGIKIAEKLLALNPDSVSLVLYLVNLYSQNGKLEKARDTMIMYLNREPTDDSIRLRLAVTQHKLGKIEESVSQIDRIQSIASLSFLDQFNIGMIFLSSVDRKEQGVSLLYKARYEEYHNPQVHEFFVQSISMNYNRPIDEVEPEVIAVDCYVQLISEYGNVLEYIITESRFEKNAILPTEFPANALIGLHIGDTTNIGADLYTVKKIWSKITHAFRDSLNQIETRFSDQDMGLKVFKIKEDGTEEEKLSGMLQILEGVQEHVDKVEETYAKEFLPFGTCCSLLKINPIIYWFDLRIKKVGIVSSLNNNDVVGDIFKESKDAIFETSALFTSYFNENINIYKGIFNQLFVSKSTVDLLRSEIAEAELLVNKDICLADLDYSEVNLLTIDRTNILGWVYLLRTILNYVIQNFKEIDSEASDDYQQTVDYNKKFGISFHDSIRIAENKDLFFVSEDARFNLVAYYLKGINAASTSELLVSLHENNKIQLDEYYNEIAMLYHYNYMNLPINGLILLKLYEASGFVAANPFLLGINRIAESGIDTQLVHSIYLQFFRALLAKYSEAVLNKELIKLILNEVNKYSEQSFLHFISNFRLLLQVLMIQHPARATAIMKILDDLGKE